MIFVVYTALFTTIALALLVQLFRKRDSFCIKERIPTLVILQLLCTVFVCVAWSTAVTPGASAGWRCAAQKLVVNGVGGMVFIILALRMWILFRRFYLGKYFQKQRERMLQYSKSHVSIAINLAPSLSHSTKFRLVKFGMPVYFVAVSLLHSVTWITQFALASPATATATTTCTNSFTAAPATALVFLSATSLMVGIGWAMRRFRDNFNIALEFRRYVVYFFVFVCASMVVFVLSNNRLPDEYLIFAFQMTLVLSGILPLWEQQKLDKRIAAEDFDAHEKLEKLLQDPAALVAFQKYVRQEFCEETLEFYQAVVDFRRSCALSTPAEQLRYASVIYTSYLAPDAPSQINISAQDLEAIRKELLGGKSSENLTSAAQHITAPKNDINLAIFDRAQQEMSDLLTDGAYTRFRSRHSMRASQRNLDVLNAAKKVDIKPIQE